MPTISSVDRSSASEGDGSDSEDRLPRKKGGRSNRKRLSDDEEYRPEKSEVRDDDSDEELLINLVKKAEKQAAGEQAGKAPSALPPGEQAGNAPSRQLITWKDFDEYNAFLGKWTAETTPMLREVIENQLNITLTLSLDQCSNVFAIYTSLKGMVMKIRVRDEYKFALPIYMSRHLEQGNHPILRTLQSQGCIDVVIVQVQNCAAGSCHIIQVVALTSFMQVVKQHWRTAPDTFFQTPEEACGIFLRHHLPEILNLQFIKGPMSKYLRSDTCGQNSADLCYRICACTIEGGFFMNDTDLPIALRGDEGSAQPNFSGGQGAKGMQAKSRKNKPATLKSMLAAYKQKMCTLVTSAKSKGQRKEAPGPRSRTRRSKPRGLSAAIAQGPPQNDGLGRGEPTSAKPGKIVNRERLRERIADPGCVVEMMSKEVMLAILLSPDIMESLRTFEAGPPTNAREVEDAVFTKAVVTRIYELNQDTELSDLRQPLEDMRQRLVAGLPAAPPVAGASARFWTSVYIDTHASFLFSNELKQVCSTVHTMLAALLGKIFDASRLTQKPDVSPQALVSQTLELLYDESSIDDAVPPPSVPFQAAAHVAMQHVLDLRLVWNAQKVSKDPPKEVFRQYLSLKGHTTTAVFITPEVMLAVSKAKTRDAKSAVLEACAKEFLSPGCKLIEDTVLKQPPPCSAYMTWI